MSSFNLHVFKSVYRIFASEFFANLEKVALCSRFCHARESCFWTFRLDIPSIGSERSMIDGTLAKSNIDSLSCRMQTVTELAKRITTLREDHITGASVIAGNKAIDRSKDSGSSGELLAGISLTEQFV